MTALPDDIADALPEEPPVDVDFLLVGVQKCATGWLSQCLDEHPDLAIDKPYEKGFLNPLRGVAYLDANPDFLGDWDAYEDLLAPDEPGRLRGDATVALYNGGQEAAEVVHRLYPDAKVLLQLRDPAERTWSALWHARIKGREPCPDDWRRMLEESQVLDLSRYDEGLAPWLDRFPDDQVHVTLDLDLQEDPQALVAGVYGFLDVDPDVTPPSLEVTRGGSGDTIYRRSWIRPLEAAVNAARTRGLDALVDPIADSPVGSLVDDLAWDRQEKPDLPADVEAELRDRLAPSVRNLEDLVDRDLEAWLDPETPDAA